VGNRVVWAGRYAVFDEIASGGMASVYLACRLEGPEGPRVVAIKKMFESFAKRPEFVTMFLDEAHIATRIRHPNVVATHEFLRIPDSLGIVMEFVLGVSFDDLLAIARDRGVVAPLGVTVSIVRDALEGLHAAHEAKDDKGQLVGLVHRDVSPHNILVGREGVARVIDFGIAKAAGRLQVTDVGVMKGKFGYMAPEQIRAAPVDRRVDIYSAGVVLWEAVTGQSLFQGSTDIDTFTRRGAGEVAAPPASTIADGLPPALDALIQKSLATNPDERFATAEEMSDALLGITEPASRAAVSEWVVSLAGSRLRELEAKRNEVETAYAAGELTALGNTLPAAHVPVSATPSVPSRAATPPLELDIPELAPRPPASKPASKPKPAAAPKPAPVADDDDVFGAPRGADLSLDLGSQSAPRPRRPSVSDARVSRASIHGGEAVGSPQPRRQKSGGRGAWGVLLLLLVAGAGAAYQFGPGYLASLAVASAARRGLMLSVESLEPRSGGFTLTRATVGLSGVSGLAAKASEVMVDLDWQGNVRKISVPGFELSVHGDARELASRFAAWRAAPHVPLAFEAKAGHLVWTDVLVPGVNAEGINASLQMGGADDGAISLDAPSVTVSLPRGSVGPWRAHLESTVGDTKLTVSLDRAKTDGPPSIVVVSRPALGTVINATIPRTKVVQIGVPADFFLAGSDPEVDLVLEAQAMPTGEPVSAHVVLGLFGGLGSAQPADLVLDGNIQGDSAQPLHIDPGTLSLGKVKARLTGTISLAPDGIRAEVDRPQRTGPPLPPFVVDTRDWTAPSKEKPAPPPPPSASAMPAPSARPRR
jgi:serine/threonine-protein kinase